MRIEENHVHLFVETYKPLAWAIPLNDYDFYTKDISDINTLIDVIQEFCSKINLVTRLDYEGRLLL